MRHRQLGVNTLFFTLVLLLLTSLVLLYTTRGAITEQRLSANEIRAKQAFAAASAGLDHGLAYFRDGVDHDADLAVDTIASESIFDNGQKASYYQVAFCSPSSAPPDCPAAHTTAIACAALQVPPAVTVSEFLRPLVVSCGWSDDDSSVVRQTQGVQGVPALPGQITTPIISRGVTNLLTGGASVLNYFNDLTIWAGGNVPVQSMTGKTFVRDIAAYPAVDPEFDYRDTGNSPSCNNPPAGYQCSTDGSRLGHDTVVNDSSIATLTQDEFFERIMGRQPDVYRDTVATWHVDLNNSLDDEDTTDVGSLDGMGDAVIWVEGDASMSGTIGTLEHPVVLVVNGDLTLGNNLVINGMVYVTGDLNGSGSPTVYGALVSAGNVNVTGNLKIVFDPNTLGGTSAAGKRAALAGSWKDW